MLTAALPNNLIRFVSELHDPSALPIHVGIDHVTSLSVRIAACISTISLGREIEDKNKTEISVTQSLTYTQKYKHTRAHIVTSPSGNNP